MITDLKPSEIFVFGSNQDGHHIGGAARLAYDKFGAVWGIGHGLMGQSYAIDTMSGLDKIKIQAIQFKHIARLLKDYTFLLTPVGTGIAGYNIGEIEPLFSDLPNNVKKVGWDA